LFSIYVSWLHAHGREILWDRRETLKQNLIRLAESPVIKNDDSVNATSITIDSVDPLPLNEGRPTFRLSFAGPAVSATLPPTIPETGKATCKRRRMDIVT